MKANMGAADRIIRVILALGIAALFFTGVITGTLGIILMIVAGIFLLTSFISFCPLYFPVKLSTAKKRK